MMMSLDRFVFSLKTVPYAALQRHRNWKHKTSARVGARDASQFTGPGDDTITLNGVIAPETIGSAISLQGLAHMANLGEAYALVDGSGYVYGAFVIDSLIETETYHTPEGIPRRIAFTLALKRVDDRSVSRNRNVASM